MGKANKRLMYVDQVLQLVYEDGSLCPSKSGLRYKSVISFVCRPEAGPTNRPMLISLDKQTCTLFFSWHTPLACEQMVSVGLGTCDTEQCPRPGCTQVLSPDLLQFTWPPADAQRISSTPGGPSNNWFNVPSVT